MRNFSGWLLASLIAGAAVFAQTPSPAFEVASVKPNTLDDRIVTVNVGPGARFAARGYTLVLLIQRAYGVMDWNITGGPGWIRTDRFDVSAKANIPGNLTERQLRPMLQALLADRFKLRLHPSSEEVPGYALVTAKGGPKVKPSADGEGHPDTFRYTNTGLSGQGISMADFARYVGGKLGLVAVDETGLPGFYDVKADWKVEIDPSDPDPRAAMLTAVLAAVQDQLGLKFAAKKITIRTLVIDHAERASGLEN
jgi:uncharacterized protein (TIGR03435 family)